MAAVAVDYHPINTRKLKGVHDVVYVNQKWHQITQVGEKVRILDFIGNKKQPSKECIPLPKSSNSINPNPKKH